MSFQASEGIGFPPFRQVRDAACSVAIYKNSVFCEGSIGLKRVDNSPSDFAFHIRGKLRGASITENLHRMAFARHYHIVDPALNCGQLASGYDQKQYTWR